MAQCTHVLSAAYPSFSSSSPAAPTQPSLLLMSPVHTFPSLSWARVIPFPPTHLPPPRFPRSHSAQRTPHVSTIFPVNHSPSPHPTHSPSTKPRFSPEPAHPGAQAELNVTVADLNATVARLTLVHDDDARMLAAARAQVTQLRGQLYQLLQVRRASLAQGQTRPGPDPPNSRPAQVQTRPSPDPPKSRPVQVQTRPGPDPPKSRPAQVQTRPRITQARPARV